MNEMPASTPPAPVADRRLIFAAAAAAGLAVANIYYNQPMLAMIEAEVPGPLTGAIPTATQFGYALGLFLLVPLGDIVERRRLIVVQFGVLAVALALAASAPDALLIVLSSLLVGLAATVAQQIVPLAAHLSPPERRGSTVGTILAGILAGILLSRTLAGFVATHGGWRAMFWLGVPLALVAGGLMAAVLPRSRPETTMGYGKLLRSIGHLWREFPELRRAAVTQALIFAAFTVFWTILPFYLSEPPFGLGAEVAGLFGVLGVVGILAAPLAGKITDWYGPTYVVAIGAVLAVMSWVVLGAWGALLGLAAGVLLLDIAMQVALVANQHVVFALRAEARARLNTVLMGSMFLGGAFGSAAATGAWQAARWPAVVGLGIALCIAATVIQAYAAARK